MPKEAELREVAREVSNWGRWGADDELGTLNLLTAEVVAASARLVHHGRVISLGTSLDSNGIWGGNTVRRNPVHLMTVDGGDAETLLGHVTGWDGPGESLTALLWGQGITRFNDDFVMMPLQAASHWDALSHMYYDGQMYNGFPASAVTSLGATRLSIDKVHRKGIAGRGVLLDVARHRGVDHLPSNEAVLPAELDQVAEAQGVEVRSGDLLLVRTGWWGQFALLRDPGLWRSGSPGLSWTCAEWLRAKDVAAVASDNTAVEASNYDLGSGDVAAAMHLLCLRDMGLTFGELWDLEELGRDCAADGVWEFQLIAPPLRVTGAVGSPVTPIALK